MATFSSLASMVPEPSVSNSWKACEEPATGTGGQARGGVAAAWSTAPPRVVCGARLHAPQSRQSAAKSPAGLARAAARPAAPAHHMPLSLRAHRPRRTQSTNPTGSPRGSPASAPRSSLQAVTSGVSECHPARCGARRAARAHLPAWLLPCPPGPSWRRLLVACKPWCSREPIARARRGDRGLCARVDGNRPVNTSPGQGRGSKAPQNDTMCAHSMLCRPYRPARPGVKKLVPRCPRSSRVLPGPAFGGVPARQAAAGQAPCPIQKCRSLARGSDDRLARLAAHPPAAARRSARHRAPAAGGWVGGAGCLTGIMAAVRAPPRTSNGLLTPCMHANVSGTAAPASRPWGRVLDGQRTPALGHDPATAAPARFPLASQARACLRDPAAPPVGFHLCA
jgi:hypothetical protein